MIPDKLGPEAYRDLVHQALAEDRGAGEETTTGSLLAHGRLLRGRG